MRKKEKIKKPYLSPTVELTVVQAESERRKGVVRLIIMTCVLSLAYIFSAFTTDIKSTNEKLLYVLIFVVVGFLATVILFYLSVYVSFWVEKIKRKNIAKKISYEFKDFEYILEKNENVFTYDKSKSFMENLGNVKDIGFNIVKDVALKIKGEGKRFYLKFALTDAIQIVTESVVKVQNKADAFFEKLRLDNKPLYIVEGTLQKLIDGENEEEIAVTNDSGIFGFFKKAKQKALNIGVNVAVTVFKSNIEKLVGDVLKSVLIESVKLYSGREIVCVEDNENE